MKPITGWILPFAGAGLVIAGVRPSGVLPGVAPESY
jgi:hypothetical protein